MKTRFSVVTRGSPRIRPARGCGSSGPASRCGRRRRSAAPRPARPADPVEAAGRPAAPRRSGRGWPGPPPARRRRCWAMVANRVLRLADQVVEVGSRPARATATGRGRRWRSPRPARSGIPPGAGSAVVQRHGSSRPPPIVRQSCSSGSSFCAPGAPGPDGGWMPTAARPYARPTPGRGNPRPKGCARAGAILLD